MRQRGFTLIEVLIAVAIMTIVSVMAFTSLGFITSSQEYIGLKQSQVAALQYTYQMIKQDTQQSIARTVRDQLGSKQGGFKTSYDDVFLSITRLGRSNPANLSRSELQFINYQLKDGQLTRFTHPTINSAADSLGIPLTFDLELEEVSVRFLDSEGRWHTSWPVSATPALATTLPVLTEWKIQTTDQKNFRWLFEQPS
ncbi:MAG: type II secretion system minor pseudopilin GspJ [Gammaproteobacteria bacterium]|nr:type II secretion system minor pseudopilin GspJ [Gammaproteobacteria bacterium]